MSGKDRAKWQEKLSPPSVDQFVCLFVVTFYCNFLHCPLGSFTIVFVRF